jgi:alkylation response protein AidB-like acyl-CoA dehydrogenase
MQFHLDETQLALQSTVRTLCANHFSLATVADREGQPADETAWRALADLGVMSMLVPGAIEGVGIVEAVIAFEELGAHLASGPLIWSTIGAAVVEGVAEGDVRVAGVIAGTPTGAVGDPAADLPVVIEHGDEADVVLVVYPERIEGFVASLLPNPRPGSPLDPLTSVAVVDSLPSGHMVGDTDHVAQLVRHGTLLHAASLVGVARAALDVARGYALEREQFGAPIGSFQAIKHLLADMFVRVEMARAETYAAAALAAADHEAADVLRSTRAAKLLAGEAGLGNGRAAVQILGGMGFTWDMLPHYFLKRAWVLEHGFGSGSVHAAALGAAIGQEVAA